MNKSLRIFFADGSLLIVAAVWGLTFVTVKNAIALLDPFNFNFYRFSLAAVVMFLFALPKYKSLKRSTIAAGVLVGVFLFAGYSFQTLGLLYTSASNAGFFTGLSVICVPIIGTIITKKWPGTGIIISVLCAATGLAFFSAGDLSRFNTGDVLVLICALSFALHIIFVGRYSPHHSTVWLVTVQIATVALLSGVFGFFLEDGLQRFTYNVWPALVITALFATCFAFFTQNYMQRFTSPSHTAIIFTMEPVFTAFFAVLLLQETLSVNAYWGGAFIVAGMLLSEVGSIPWFKRKQAGVLERQG